MIKPSLGDIIIVNDLIGFCTKVDGKKVVLNTLSGSKEVTLGKNSAVMATAQDLAVAYANRMLEVIDNL